jgi:NAD(P)-dependent dehydrogenase (short-subunit alcohol dehydrogenase family)
MDDSSKHVVITGSTRGIGYGLAEAFLALGCTVTISGRGETAAHQAAAKLAERFGAQRVIGIPCDVNDPAALQELWNASIKRFNKVDLWINNAGWSGEQGMVWERPSAEVDSIVSTNITGSIYGAQTAMRGMLKQGFGAIYNMQGMGADGRKHAGLAVYGTTKYAVHYFTQSLALEAKGTPVVIGGLRPGMIVTDMIFDRYKDRPADFARAKPIFNIIAERVENVAPWLAGRMLANKRNGAILSYSSSPKLLWRFISQPFVRRDLFS